MAVSKRLRYEILRRDNHQCRYCGASSPEVKLAVDHVMPVALGGGDEPTNLVAACMDCNIGKSATAPGAELVDDVAQDALRWASAIRRATEIDRARRTSDTQFFNDFVDRMVELSRRNGSYELPDIEPNRDREDFTRSILQFRDSGLDLDDLEYAIGRAMSNRRLQSAHIWRYFCGIAWRMVEQRQITARALLEEEEPNGA